MQATILKQQASGQTDFVFPVDNFIDHAGSRVGLSVSGDMTQALIIFGGKTWTSYVLPL